MSHTAFPDTSPSQESRHLQWSLAAVLVLLVVTLVAYLPNINDIGLYLDDWRNIGDLSVDGKIDFLEARPLNLRILALGWSLFGLNVQAYLLTAIGLHFVSAFMLWLLLYILMPRSYQALSLPIAALFLVYPSNYSRLWLTLWPHSLLFTMVITGILAYVLYLQRGSLLWLLLSLVLLGASLFWYELQLALILALPILAITQLRTASWLRRLLIFSPSILALWFLVFMGQATVVGYKTSGLVFALPELARRFIKSYWTTLIVSWVEPVRFLGLQEFTRWQAAFAFFCFLLAVVLFAVILSGWLNRRGHFEPQIHQPARNTWFWTACAFLGFITIGLGVLPGLPRGEVRAAVFDGRFTLFSAIGAATLVVFLLYGLSQLRRRPHREGVLIVYLVTTVLICVATVFQWGAQIKLAKGWDRQQCAWQSMLAQAPSFQDDTYIHIIDVPAVPGIWGVSPFGMLVAEVDSAAKLLYANSSLHGSFVHTGTSSPIEGIHFSIAPTGILNEDTQQIVPYNQAVIFRYRADDSLELLKEIPAELSGANGPQATGVDRILPIPVVSPYRSLIEPFPSCAYAS